MSFGEIRVTANGWNDDGGISFVAHVTTPCGDAEAVEIGHIGQWEYRLARLIRTRWPGTVGRWLVPWLHMVIEPAEVV